MKTLHAMTGVSKREVRTFMRETAVLSRWGGDASLSSIDPWLERRTVFKMSGYNKKGAECIIN